MKEMRCLADGACNSIAGWMEAVVVVMMEAVVVLREAVVVLMEHVIPSLAGWRL